MGPAKDIVKGDLPDWIKAQFLTARDYLTESLDLQRLSVRGITSLQHAPGLIKALQTLDNTVGEEHRAELSDAARAADLAKQEVEKDFPRLNAHSVVDAWMVLEVFVRDLVAAWFVNETSALANPTVQKVKGPLVEFSSMEEHQRAAYLVRELERQTNALYKSGVGRFEALLEVCDLSPTVQSSAKRDLFELNQVRNVIVHNASVADSTLVSKCPWMGLRIGQPVRVTTDDHNRYVLAVVYYMLAVIDAIGRYFGMK